MHGGMTVGGKESSCPKKTTITPFVSISQVNFYPKTIRSSIHSGSSNLLIVFFFFALFGSVERTGEQRISAFEPHDLRLSQDWSHNRWNSLRERPDIVSCLLSDSMAEVNGKDGGGSTPAPLHGQSDVESPPGGVEDPPRLDLALDDLFGRLKWSSSRKRCGRGFARRRQNWAGDSDGSSDSSGRGSAGDSSGCLKFLSPPPLMADSEACKFRGGRLFDDSTAISNLVVS